MINFIVSLTMSTKTGFAQKLARWAGKVSFGTGEPETLSTADVVRDGGLSPVTLRHSLSIKTEGMIAPLLSNRAVEAWNDTACGCAGLPVLCCYPASR